MLPKFIVWNTTGYGSDIGDRDTFEAAEKLARWHAARRGIRVQIDHQIPGRTEQVAAVIRDASGRLWTDLTWEGAQLV